MKSFKISESDLKDITLFLIEKKVILHPVISPEGVMDFTGHRQKNYVLILDRNLVITLLKLVSNGILKDKFSLKLISSLMSWIEINNVSINAGLALAEYSHHHRRNGEASAENNLFQKIFDSYNPDIWFNLALGRVKKISPITLDKSENINYQFFVESDHFKMHFLEMLKIAQVHFDENLTTLEKFRHLHQWIYYNILMSDYTHVFAALVFGGKSKVFKGPRPLFEDAIKTCSNQAWDMTYLSIWSTYYYYENSTEDIHLFATNDKELKELFTLAQSNSANLYKKLYGDQLGSKITALIKQIYIPRKKPDIESKKLDELIIIEKAKLEVVLSS